MPLTVSVPVHEPPTAASDPEVLLPPPQAASRSKAQNRMPRWASRCILVSSRAVGSCTHCAWKIYADVRWAATGDLGSGTAPAAATSIRQMQVVQKREGCNPRGMRATMAWVLGGCLLSACGGGGGGGSTSPVGWQSGVFHPSAVYAAKCVAPRAGIDPGTNMAFPDRAGTLLDENNWLRSWTNELYLWYSEVRDQNPGLFATTSSYFKVLKTTATTPSGAPKDKFHFASSTDQWEAMSVGGV